MYVVQRYVGAALDVETSALAVAVAACDGTVVDDNVGVVIDENDLTVVDVLGKSAVDGVTVEIESYICILGDVDGIVVKAVAVRLPPTVIGEIAQTGWIGSINCSMCRIANVSSLAGWGEMRILENK